MINITLPDGSIKQMEKGCTPYEVAQAISEGLARNVLVAKVNDQLVELDKPINEDATLTLYTWNDREGKDTFWHSSAHLMAAAIESLYPGVKFGIGPHIETGFYYDIDFMDYSISSDDFPKIEEKMKELASQKIQFVRREVPKAEALDYFTKKGDEYKLELIDGLEDGQISFYESGPFTDLCRGPHLHDTSAIKAIKLLKTAGAYWRGNEKRKQLTRIYAVTSPRRRNSTNIWLSSKRQLNATTANWVVNWNCSPSPRSWVRVCRCGCRRAPLCATVWNSSFAKCRKSMVTSRLSPRISVTSTSIRLPVTMPNMVRTPSVRSPHRKRARSSSSNR